MGGRLWKWYLAAQIAAVVAYAFPTADTWFATGWQVAIGWTAVAFVVVGIVRQRPQGMWAWILLALGVFSNVTGILVESVQRRVLHVTANPTVADGLWLALYPFMAAGLATIIRRRNPTRDLAMLVDSAIIITGLGLLAWVFLIRPQSANPSFTLLARLAVVAYPVADLVVIGLTVRLLLDRGRRGPAFGMMLASCLCFLGSDIGWAIVGQSSSEAGPVVARGFEMNSLMAYVLIGAAALHPSARDVASRVSPRPIRLSRQLLAGLSVTSLGAPALLAFEALRHRIDDGIAIAVCSAVLFLLVVVRMAQLLGRIEEHSITLDRRNAATRLVLDTVNEGLLRITADGIVGTERSAMVDRWFGPVAGAVALSDYLAPIDPAFAHAFRLSHAALIECALTPEIHLSQMPSRLRAGGRELEVSYLPTGDVSTPDGGLLLVITDQTEQRRLARQEAEQTELLALFRLVTRDRTGLLTFMREADEIVGSVSTGDLDLVTRKQLIHTLKGNAAVVGLSLVARLCHEAEEALDGDDSSAQAAVIALTDRWRALEDELRSLTGGGLRSDVVEISTRELEEVHRDLAGGLSREEAAHRLAALWCEPLERPLARLATQAHALALKLGKGDALVDVRAADLRLDPRHWGPLWTELVHVVNNAVDHGFESPEERAAAGKPARPHLTLVGRLEWASLVLEISDDGRGIDWAALKSAARARGLPVDDSAPPSAALFAPSLSTRADVSAVSGRGLGMSSVIATVRALHGDITVTSAIGNGTHWRFTFPLGEIGGDTGLATGLPVAAPEAIHRHGAIK